MNAQLNPTTRELKAERDVLFEECRGDFIFMQEVLGESREWIKHYKARDFVQMGKEMDKLLWKYLETSGLFERAESKAQGRKELE